MSVLVSGPEKCFCWSSAFELIICTFRYWDESNQWLASLLVAISASGCSLFHVPFSKKHAAIEWKLGRTEGQHQNRKLHCTQAVLCLLIHVLSQRKKYILVCCLQCWDPKKDRAILVCLPFSCISMCVMCRGGPWLGSVLDCLYNTIMCSIIRSRDRNSLWFGGWNAEPNLLGYLSSCGHRRIKNAIDRRMMWRNEFSVDLNLSFDLLGKGTGRFWIWRCSGWPLEREEGSGEFGLAAWVTASRDEQRDREREIDPY